MPNRTHSNPGAGRSLGLCGIVVLAVALLGASPAWADRLEVEATAPWWMRLGADMLLYLHIGGGAVGLVSGATALLARKGAKLHRFAGRAFFISMLIMSGIGGVVAPLLNDRLSTVAGLVTFYLIASGWATARRRSGVGVAEIVGLCVAVAGAASIYTLSWMAWRAPEGTLDGSPPQGFFVFSLVCTIAMIGDLKVVLRRGISGAQRVARHVWRMCFGLFVASGSLFLGQMQMFPEWLRETPILYIAALAPLPFLLFWMLYVRLSRRYNPKPALA
ncbi:MAG: hypothetical protein ABL883_11665 [Terricaulis sp.]